jgi:hypothetical protein
MAQGFSLVAGDLKEHEAFVGLDLNDKTLHNTYTSSLKKWREKRESMLTTWKSNIVQGYSPVPSGESGGTYDPIVEITNLLDTFVAKLDERADNMNKRKREVEDLTKEREAAMTVVVKAGLGRSTIEGDDDASSVGSSPTSTDSAGSGGKGKGKRTPVQAPDSARLLEMASK